MSDMLLFVCHSAAIVACCLLWMLMVGMGLTDTLRDQRYRWLHLAVLSNLGAQFSPLWSLPQTVLLILVAVTLMFFGSEMLRRPKRAEVRYER